MFYEFSLKNYNDITFISDSEKFIIIIYLTFYTNIRHLVLYCSILIYEHCFYKLTPIRIFNYKITRYTHFFRYFLHLIYFLKNTLYLCTDKYEIFAQSKKLMQNNFKHIKITLVYFQYIRKFFLSNSNMH